MMGDNFKLVMVVIALVFLVLAGSLTLRAEGFTVSWTPNTEADLAGYNVYYWRSGLAQWEQADAGNQTSFTLEQPPENIGKQYYFRVTAYDASGNESDASEQVRELFLPIPKQPNIPVMINAVFWLQLPPE